MRAFFIRKRVLPIKICFLFFALAGCTLKSHKELPNALHLVSETKIKGLDPIYSDDSYSALVVGQIYETLLEYHYLKRPYTLIPNLAESMPEISADGLTYTFHLKKGILFQDDPCFKATNGKGRELVAEDVIYSFKRLADPKLASTGWWILDEKIVGLNSWRGEGAKYSKSIEGLKALDRYTLQIKLVKRSPQFLPLLAMQFAGIVPQEAVEFYGKEFLNHGVGTGPFRLTEYNPNSKIILGRNPTYRKEYYPAEGAPGDREAGLLADAGKTLPLADQLVIQVFVERQPKWLTFMSGKIDLIAIPKDNFAEAITPGKELNAELAKKGIKLFKGPALDVTHATFNMEDPLLGKNKYLRQAMSLAYDQATQIELFYNGRAIPAQGPIPIGIFGYDPSLKNPYRQFSLAKAKELLEKAGFPEGKGLPPLEYATTADSTGRQGAEYFQKMMAAIGVKLNISAYSWPQFIETIKNKKAQIWEYAWIADYPDAENFFQLFYSKNASPGANDSNYSNPEFDQLYEKSLALGEGAERAKLYQKMVALLIEDCPWIFGAHRLNYVLIQPWLKNYKPSDFNYTRYKYYRVEPSFKK
jgi:oligopeptide transport system substrate-binding protein